LRSNKNGYSDKTHQTDSQNSDITAPGGRKLHHLQFSLQAVSPETFGYTLVQKPNFAHAQFFIEIWEGECVYVSIAYQDQQVTYLLYRRNDQIKSEVHYPKLS